jgi:hypothetical protein
VQTGDNVAIGGFIITNTISPGGTTIQNPAADSKLVAIRAVGPSLAVSGVTNPLADPFLELHMTDSNGDDVVVTTNDSWRDNDATDLGVIVDKGLDMYNDPSGAVVLDDAEPVIIATLAGNDPLVPNSGRYTAIVRGSNGETGIGLVEVYDLDDENASTELGNISTRGFVGTAEDVLIGGVIVGPKGGGLVNSDVIVRALGPSLADQGVADALADPTLELINSDGDPIATNDNWQDFDEMQKVIDAGLDPSDPNESAIFATLTPGLYTAIASGVDATTGVALIEIYHVPSQTAAK